MGTVRAWVQPAGLAAALGVVLMGVTTGGCGKPSAAGTAPGGPGGGPGAVPEVSVVVVQPERVAVTTELPGRVSAYLVAEVRPQVSGIVQERLFEEGSDVKAGEVRYRIDPAVFQAACDTAAANLLVAERTADRSRAALGVSHAGVARQKATLQFAMANRERFEELVKDGGVSASQRDQAVTESEVCQASLRAAEAQVENDQAAVAAAEAAIQQAKAALAAARINLDYTQVMAPISGRIGKSAVTVGALATAHQPVPFATIQQLDPVYVDASQSSASLLGLQQRLAQGGLARDTADGATVTLRLEHGAPYAGEGTLKFSDVTVDPSTGSVSLRMVFPNPDGVLLPGMFVRAVVTEGVYEQAIMAPQQAVARDPKGRPIALVVDASGTVQQRALTLDRAIGDRWLVLAGLNPGDNLVVEGLQKARPGTGVKAVPFAAGGAEPAASEKTAKAAATAN